MADRKELFRYRALILVDGLLDPRLHDWFSQISGVSRYKYLKLPSLVAWKEAYEQEREWWYNPSVQTTSNIRAEMKNFHTIMNRKRTDFQKSDDDVDMFTQEKKELFDEIVDTAQLILEYTKYRQVDVPRDDLGMAIRHAVERVAPEAKYKRVYARSNKVSEDMHADESLVVAGIYHCLNGMPTNIVSADNDIRKLAQKGIAALATQFDIEETLNRFPLRVYFRPPNNFEIMQAYISQTSKRRVVTEENAPLTVLSTS